MEDSLEKPIENTSQSSKEKDNNSESIEEVRETEELKDVPEKDQKNALIVWAILHQEHIPAASKIQIAKKFENKTGLKRAASDRLVDLYCIESKYTSNRKPCFQWNPKYNIPQPKEPEVNPEWPESGNDTYQEELPNFQSKH